MNVTGDMQNGIVHRRPPTGKTPNERAATLVGDVVAQAAQEPVIGTAIAEQAVASDALIPLHATARRDRAITSAIAAIVPPMKRGRTRWLRIRRRGTRHRRKSTRADTGTNMHACWLPAHVAQAIVVIGVDRIVTEVARTPTNCAFRKRPRRSSGRTIRRLPLESTRGQRRVDGDDPARHASMNLQEFQKLKNSKNPRVSETQTHGSFSLL